MSKILLIDDDKNLTDIFEAALQKGGFTVAVAHDGKTGLDKVESENPDLVLLDQVLPDQKGVDILKIIKDAHKDLPVAMLSNFGQQEIIDQAYKEGASEYILKYQISPDDLIAKVKQLITRLPARQG